ncbi:hypothetical protein [Pedobacter sandarakinus]|uniref:hypothetical protein n=1 Tax=Pedobacter sandarakinus TaxID=353156 RepID=UPI0022463B0D|nr:hypothetical protein [Pedobacter sandarakinus]MCX2575610.1 hypothetical protein [Pedobacter sandarakinus]
MINQLTDGICTLLDQTEQAITNITDLQFSAGAALLGGATIGQHIRHIIEFYNELFLGYETGTINYDDRKRDHAVENDRQIAIAKIKHIKANVNRIDRPLHIKASLSSTEDVFQMPTTYFRELMYNLEHTVHHMALIRVGINLNCKISLPPDFGVAASTIKYRQICAQ